MEDILYTLLAFGWIAYGIYKGIQKNKKTSSQNQVRNQSAQEPVQESKKASALDAVFGELFDLPKVENDEMRHPYQEKVLKKNPKSQTVSEIHLEEQRLDSYSGSDSVSSVFEGDLQEDSGRIIANKEVDSQYEEEGDEHEENAIDLRQAVIHQIILDRPY